MIQGQIVIAIPEHLFVQLTEHLFQSDVEQAAFLFAEPSTASNPLLLSVKDLYLVPDSGWEIQTDVYLQMLDSERSKVMKLARDSGLAIIDCHSHPGAGTDVWFSPSDVWGITEFAQYALWKLRGKPFAAIVLAERSVDAVAWPDRDSIAMRISEVQIVGSLTKCLTPTNSWFKQTRGRNRKELYGK